jgi:hypothetical protein
MHKNFPFDKFEKYDETSSVTSFKSISSFSDVKVWFSFEGGNIRYRGKVRITNINKIK